MLHTSGLVDLEAWDRAGWSWVAWGTDPGGEGPPLLLPVFSNEVEGRKVFADLIAKLGHIDEHELLQVSVIEGDIPGKDRGYSVYISTDFENYRKYLKDQDALPDARLIGLPAKYRRMNANPNSPFLSDFKRSYSIHKRYFLVPAFGPYTQAVSEFKLAVQKSQIRLLRAENLGPNDREKVVLA